jgi:hypothetical protein
MMPVSKICEPRALAGCVLLAPSLQPMDPGRISLISPVDYIAKSIRSSAWLELCDLFLSSIACKPPFLAFCLCLLLEFDVFSTFASSSLTGLLFVVLPGFCIIGIVDFLFRWICGWVCSRCSVLRWHLRQ